MTVSSTTVKNSYSGNGSTTQFAYGFKIFADSDLIVIIRSSTGTETVKTLTTHYTVAGAGDASGGSITFTTGNTPASGETVVIIREVPQTQAIDYIANDPFPAESHEEGLDRATMTTQQVQEEVDRSLKLSRTNTMTSTEFTVGATDRANKVLSFDSSGELAVTQELGTFRGNWSASTAYQVRDLVKDTSTNNIFMANTAHTSSGSQPLTSNTDSAKWDLIVDAATATTSSTSAANSATAAANSATASANSATASANSASAASTSESNAATSASTASTQATNSANSATASANSASAAAATFDLFDDSYLGAKSSNPTVDNDGNALQDGALYFDTTNDVMKVYNLSTTTWLQLTPTVSNQNNINSAVANASNINAAVANASNINAAVANASNINSAVSNASNINAVAGISTAITNVNNNSSNINAVNANSANINLTAGSIGNVNNVGGSIANVNSVASNLASVNNFGEVYRIASSAPSTSLNAGDLYFDTSTNILNVYGASGWQNAGSSVNGTSDRFKFVASGTPTTFSGSDANGNTLSYDAGFIDVYLNGIKMVNGTDVTVTSGSSIVFASALTNGDIVEAVAFGTFSVANLNASNLTSGTVPSARISGAYTGITEVGTLTGLTTTGNINFGDSDKAIFGAGSDLQISHNGSHSYIEELGTGNLFVNTNGAKVAVISNSDTSGGKMAEFNADSSVELYHDGSLKLATASTGVAVTGDLTATGNISTGNNGMVFILDNAGQKSGRIVTDSSSANALEIGADPDNSASGSYTAFRIDNSEKVRLDASGNLFIGKTASNSNVAGVQAHADGFGSFTRSGDKPLILNRLTDDGDIINLRKDGTTVGTIGAFSGKMHIASNGNSGIRFRDDLNGIIPCNSDGSNSDADQDLGHSGVRYRRLYLSSGVRLGGTGTANELDDYEEGTFTPVFANGTSGSSYQAQVGRYTKIGNQCIFQLQIQGNGLGATTGQLRISGLPFTALNAAPYGGAVVNLSNNFRSDGDITLHKGANDDEIYFYQYSGSNFLGTEATNINAGLLIHGHYITA
nr:putative tail fiber [uncultured Mediterranean phage uvMED]